MTGPTDAELMAKLRGGDSEALGGLIDRHQDAMVNYLTRLTGSRDRGEEIAQETFLRLVQAAASYREEGRLLPWLYRVATNLVRTEDRRVRRWRMLEGTFLIHAFGPAAVQAPAAQTRLLRSEAHEVLAEALAELPLRLRAPLVMAAVEGRSHQEIAELLGCREGTVKSRIHRGRRRLRARLTPYFGGHLEATPI
jgi:RNA polymerase sigma-70 factor, ECF subfamily